MLQARLNFSEQTNTSHEKVPPRPFKPPNISLPKPVTQQFPLPLIPTVKADEVDNIHELPPPLPETSPPSTPLPNDDIPLPPPPPSMLKDNIANGVERNEELIQELLATPIIINGYLSNQKANEAIMPSENRANTILPIEIPSKKSVTEIVTQLKLNGVDNQHTQQENLENFASKANTVMSKNSKNKENNTNLSNNTIKSGLSFAKSGRPIETVIITSPDTIPICIVCDTKIVR